MATQTSWIQQRVGEYFVSGENNCAMTMIKILAEVFDVSLDAQVVHAAQAMPGAGGVGDLCGLVSGVLMFVGLWGGHHGLHRSVLRPMSQGFSEGGKECFGSILCRDLQGECGLLAVGVLDFAIPYLRDEMNKVLENDK